MKKANWPWKSSLRIGLRSYLCYLNIWILWVTLVSHISQANYTTSIPHFSHLSWEERSLSHRLFGHLNSWWAHSSHHMKGSLLVLLLDLPLPDLALERLSMDSISFADAIDRTWGTLRLRHATHTDWRAGDIWSYAQRCSSLLLRAGCQGLYGHISQVLLVSCNEKTKVRRGERKRKPPIDTHSALSATARLPF